MTAPTDAMRQAVDTLEQNARRVISDCVHLRRQWDEHPDGPAEYAPERIGYVDEVEVGDRVMIDQQWREVATVHVDVFADMVRLTFTQAGVAPFVDKGTHGIRIQKRSTVTEGEGAARFEALDDDPFVMDGPPAEVAPFTGFPSGGFTQEEQF